MAEAAAVDEGRVRPMGIEDLDAVLAWRNHPDVRRHMFDTHEIGRDEHAAWFERSARDARVHLLVFERGAQRCGFASLVRGRHPEVADWGFYAAPDAPPGTGRRLGRATLAHAFGPLGLHKVCGQVLELNDRSLRFHAALGFREEGRLREQHLHEGRYRDVVCFGLLAGEWAVQAQGAPDD